MLGRFLQPDSVLDGLNRYTYCGNNPVVYSDPKGESFILACAIFMAVTCAAADTAIQLDQIERGQRDQFSFGELALATGVGALAGATFGGFVTGAALGVTAQNGVAALGTTLPVAGVGQGSYGGSQSGWPPGKGGNYISYIEGSARADSNQAWLRQEYGGTYTSRILDYGLVEPVPESLQPRVTTTWGLDYVEGELRFAAGYDITSPFYREEGGPVTIVGAHPGIVKYGREDATYGRNMWIHFSQPWPNDLQMSDMPSLKTHYSHLRDYLVVDGARVRAGDPIALMGNSGKTTGPHLDFETYLDNRIVDPGLFYSIGSYMNRRLW
jgi:murein DD-endopeptidase MepM/ murein hydrolase activator NlpD